MKRTSLNQKHIDLGAKMAEFAGFEMPIQYSSIIEEHLAVRTNVGVFDLSHMGEFEIHGEGAEAFLQRMTINDVAQLQPGQAQYTAMCYEDGGIVDDCVLYRTGDGYLIVVNAANIEKDFRWLSGHLSQGVELTDTSEDTTLVAVQGPVSRDLLRGVSDDDSSSLDTFPFYHHGVVSMAGGDVFCARTGYTGELGYELYVKDNKADQLWERIMTEGESFGLKPVGLGARDTLRLEMRYCLYGNEIDETTNPIEAGLGWITKVNKGEFMGRDAILEVRKQGVTRKLVGFAMKQRGIPRHGYDILVDKEIVGKVTSGSHSPSLGQGIGLGYVNVGYAKVGSEILVNMRGKLAPAEIVRTPFWTKGTIAES